MDIIVDSTGLATMEESNFAFIALKTGTRSLGNRNAAVLRKVCIV